MLSLSLWVPAFTSFLASDYALFSCCLIDLFILFHHCYFQWEGYSKDCSVTQEIPYVLVIHLCLLWTELL